MVVFWANAKSRSGQSGAIFASGQSGTLHPAGGEVIVGLLKIGSEMGRGKDGPDRKITDCHAGHGRYAVRTLGSVFMLARRRRRDGVDY